MSAPAPHRVASEVGRLRTVLLHRPGAELQRLTPRNSADLQSRLGEDSAAA